MRYAVFADIHGNLEALEAAFECAKKRRLTQFIILGDSIGYGANPNECLEWSLQNAKLHVLGNHEAAVIHEKIREKFTSSAREAIDWTAGKLRPELTARLRDLPYLQKSKSLRAAETAKQSRFCVEGLPRRSCGAPRNDMLKAENFNDAKIHGGFTLAHGTIHSPEEFHYLFDESDAYKSFLALRTSFGLVGHSHVPSFFSEKEAKGGCLKEGVLKLQKKERYLLNPGSIGQPRDRDWRLSFGILDEDELTFEIVRLPYDNKKAADKILAEDLPASLAYRLL